MTAKVMERRCDTQEELLVSPRKNLFYILDLELNFRNQLQLYTAEKSLYSPNS